MRSRAFRRSALLTPFFAMALLSSACFGGGQQAAQATATTSTAPAPVSSPPALASPQVLASPVASPSPRPGEQTYTVESGDTLAIISEKFYGDPTQWRKIYDANRSAIGDDPDKLKVGTQLHIPPKD